MATTTKEKRIDPVTGKPVSPPTVAGVPQIYSGGSAIGDVPSGFSNMTQAEQEAVTSGSGGSQTSSSGGGQTSSSSGSHTHTLGRTTLDTGTTDAHVHTYGATNEISSEASNHTHTVANHTHTVVDHTHSVPAHTHGLTFGIHEEDNSPTISFQISRDNGETYGNILGSYTADVSNLEIKDYIVASGSYIIKFTSSARARISAQLTIKLDITAR